MLDYISIFIHFVTFLLLLLIQSGGSEEKSSQQQSQDDGDTDGIILGGQLCNCRKSKCLKL
jgi:hypothetical protein